MFARCLHGATWDGSQNSRGDGPQVDPNSRFLLSAPYPEPGEKDGHGEKVIEFAIESSDKRAWTARMHRQMAIVGDEYASDGKP
jgi:hypothetical protein